MPATMQWSTIWYKVTNEIREIAFETFQYYAIWLILFDSLVIICLYFLFQQTLRLCGLPRITFARYPNRAMFGKRARGDELCKLSRKLLKICHGWINIDTINACPFCHGDEFKIRKQVLEREYPSLCQKLSTVLGIHSNVVIKVNRF